MEPCLEPPVFRFEDADAVLCRLELSGYGCKLSRESRDRAGARVFVIVDGGAGLDAHGALAKLEGGERFVSVGGRRADVDDERGVAVPAERVLEDPGEF